MPHSNSPIFEKKMLPYKDLPNLTFDCILGFFQPFPLFVQLLRIFWVRNQFFLAYTDLHQGFSIYTSLH